jgi:hypothetical protein
MRSQIERSRKYKDSTGRELELLSELQLSPELSQRRLADRLGISIGATNLLLRNLMWKGYVRVSQADWRRWLYALTPAGIYRKINLTFGYVQRFMDQYQLIRRTLYLEFKPLGLNFESRVAIYGVDDFANIVYLVLRELGIEEISIFTDDTGRQSEFQGLKVQTLNAINPDDFDSVIVAMLKKPESSIQNLLVKDIPREKIVSVFSGSGPSLRQLIPESYTNGNYSIDFAQESAVGADAKSSLKYLDGGN